MDLWSGPCRALQGVAGAGLGAHYGRQQAEFNTSLRFVSEQSKPTTPLQSRSPAGTPPLHQDLDSKKARPTDQVSSARAWMPPQLDPMETHTGAAISLRVAKPSGSSAFSPLNCSRFRPLQISQKGNPQASLPRSSFPCPACPGLLWPGCPRAAEDKAGSMQQGASSGMYFLLPFPSLPHIIARNPILVVTALLVLG